MSEALLRVRDLRVSYCTGGGLFAARRVVHAVDGVSFDLAAGQVLGLVGESGCGKSSLARAVVQLVRADAGQVLLGGRDLCQMHGEVLRQSRRQVQMVFQDPYASLNPRFSALATVTEPIVNYGLATRPEAERRAATLLERVGIDPTSHQRYPHEFSGGQRQRIGIARALAAQPSVLVCDEPVSALDVSVQAQVLGLLDDLCRSQGLSLLLIAHDLGVVRHLAHDVAVMYLGRIVEQGPAAQVLGAPRHPYTQALRAAAPIADPAAARLRHAAWKPLPGEPPSPSQRPAGCAFAGRCALASDQCRSAVPRLDGRDDGRRVACWNDDQPPAAPVP